MKGFHAMLVRSGLNAFVRLIIIFVGPNYIKPSWARGRSQPTNNVGNFVSGIIGVAIVFWWRFSFQKWVDAKMKSEVTN